MECRLVNISSGLEEMHQLKDGVTTIGRDSSNDIQILNANVSRHHARFTNLPSVCELEDAGSANGTFVNGEKITVMTLSHGSEIRIGDSVYRFEASGSVGTDDVLVQSRNYTTKSQRDTVRVKPAPEIKKEVRPVEPLRPLRPKSQS